MTIRPLLLLALGMTACIPSKKKADNADTIPSLVAPEPAAALTKAPEALIGNWSACETSSSETLKISGITHYQIKDDQNMTVSFSYYSDPACKTRFNEADAAKAVKAWERFYKEKAGDDVKDYYKSLIAGFSQNATYKASQANPGEVGSFDQTTNFETAYLSYKIVEGKLFLSAACLPSEIVAASETNCKIIGESPANRSTDFTQVVPFERVP